jgi:phosphoribosylaminoimidazolecarboxamide formyltransferase/IMP cyclohydrolase
MKKKKRCFLPVKSANTPRSNTIVLAKKGQLIASGVGQTSRVDALRQAIEKASSFGLSLDGAVHGIRCFFSHFLTVLRLRMTQESKQ